MTFADARAYDFVIGLHNSLHLGVVATLDAAARVGDAPRAAGSIRETNMALDEPVSDTSRAIQHDPDQTWPASVVLQLSWMVDGHYRTRSMVIEGDAFFGRGQYGAPMQGQALISHIENMRRAGPPPIVRSVKDAKSKIISKRQLGRRPKGGNVAPSKGVALRVKR